MARGDVLLVGLPESEGREQSGTRPAIAVQTDIAGDPMLIVAPVTSNLKAARFPFSVLIEPSDDNGLTSRSLVMVFQLSSDRQKQDHQTHRPTFSQRSGPG